MKATGLPIPTVANAPTAAAGPASSAANAAAPATGQAPTDFMLALAQLLGANVPVATTNGGERLAPLADDIELTDEEAALALLSLPMAPLQPQVLQAQAQSGDADPLELLGLGVRSDGPSARDAALLQALTERLAATGSAEIGESLPDNAPVMPSIDPQQPVRASADGAITRPVHVPVGTPAWADEIGSRLTLMTDKGQHTASLRLSPEHLGPLEVRISMRDDQASVWFGAAHADTRAAIEHALPRLRELFAAQGMSLTDAGVFREPPKQSMPTIAHGSGAGADNTAGSDDAIATRVQVGLLDAYA